MGRQHDTPGTKKYAGYDSDGILGYPWVPFVSKPSNTMEKINRALSTEPESQAISVSHEAR